MNTPKATWIITRGSLVFPSSSLEKELIPTEEENAEARNQIRTMAESIAVKQAIRHAGGHEVTRDVPVEDRHIIAAARAFLNCAS